jgi:Cu+-exporting ATPase
VTAALTALDGVTDVSVSLQEATATVHYDPTVVRDAQLVETIEDCGFDTTPAEQDMAPLLKDSNDMVQLTSLPPMSVKSKATMSAKVARTVLSIKGMTCASCVANIEKMVSPATLPGLLSISVNLMSEQGLATHDPEILSAENIAEAIDDVGFEATVMCTEVTNPDVPTDPTIDTATLKIFGMTCASCVGSVESALLTLPEVKSALVNLATQEARVVYHADTIGIRDLVHSVEDAGFDAIVADGQDNTTQLESLARTREIQEWRRAYQISALFALPTFFIQMVIPHWEWGHAVTMYSLSFLPGLYLSDVVCLLLTIPPQFGIGKRFFKPAFKSLRHRSATMDVLVTLSTLSAFFFSCVAMMVSLVLPPHNKPKTFFDTSSMLLFFVSLGRYLENRAKGQTSAALSRLMSLTPSTATIYIPSPDPETPAKETSIPTELLQKNDIVILRPGDKVPADGIVVTGETYIDESMVTGEPMPLLKTPHCLLIGGTVNGTGRIDFRVLKAGKDTQLAHIVRMVRDAQISKTKVQRFADVAASVFVPFVLGMGLLTFIVWMVLSHVLPSTRLPGMFSMEGDETSKIMLCLQMCISVIVVACPCALGLSTPTAVMVGTGVGAANGILIKGGATLEQATKITRVVFDKTGTLTVGKMCVATNEGGVQIAPHWNRSVDLRKGFWRLVSAAEGSSEHPIGRAIAREGKIQLGLIEPETPITPASTEVNVDALVTSFVAVAGKGVECSVTPSGKGKQTFRVVVGTLAFFAELGISVPEHIAMDGGVVQSHQEQGRTCVVVGIDGEYAGCLALNDQIKSSAKRTITAIRRMGMNVAMVFPLFIHIDNRSPATNWEQHYASQKTSVSIKQQSGPVSPLKEKHNS